MPSESARAPLDTLLAACGDTPLVRLRRIIPEGQAIVLAKCEFLNPGGSVKDRTALAMVDAAERDGKLAGNGVIIEPTSGNMGVSLALVAARRGYRCILTMPERIPLERRRLLRHLGAEIHCTPADEGMKAAIDRARELASRIEGSFIPGQFSNSAAVAAHRRTGEEILRDTDGRVDIIVAGVGTGATFSGTAQVLKEHHPALHAVAVEPVDSPVLTQFRDGRPLRPGAHKLLGIGPGFVPENLDLKLLDEVVQVSDDEAFDWGRRLAREEGIVAGPSSGAALAAAARLADRPESRGKVIVAILPSAGERYVNTPLFDPPAGDESDDRTYCGPPGRGAARRE